MKTIVYFTLLVGLVCFARKGKSISAKSISAVALSNPPVIFTHTKTLFRDSSAAHGSYNRQNGYRIVIYIIWLLVYLMTEGRILVLVVEIFEILSVVRKNYTRNTFISWRVLFIAFLYRVRQGYGPPTTHVIIRKYIIFLPFPRSSFQSPVINIKVVYCSCVLHENFKIAPIRQFIWF